MNTSILIGAIPLVFVLCAFFFGLGKLSSDQQHTRIRGLLQRWTAYHPRAVKLLRKGRPFLVIAWDEPYYLAVYSIIRRYESLKHTWTIEDEQAYLSEVKHTARGEDPITSVVLIQKGRFDRADNSQEMFSKQIDVPIGHRPAA